MRAWPPRRSLIILPLLVCCCEGASAQSGVTALLRVQSVQYVPGEIDQTAQAAAPEVLRIDSQNNTVYPGITGKSIGGSAGPGAAAVVVGLVGDRGHWILPVQAQDGATPGAFVFSGKASLSSEAPLGPALLVFRAVSAAGEVGPVSTQALEISAPVAQGQLVISLDWDTEADLDLRVTAPDAKGNLVEIWSRKQSSLSKPGYGEPPASADDLAAAGCLDFDSNSQCVIDGRRQESVYWVNAAPSGQVYTVRVDAFSMCGEAFAHWRARVLLDGVEQVAATGQVSDADTRFDHGPGAGLLALQFTY